MDPMKCALERVRRRLALQRWIDFVALGLLAGLTLCCAWLAFARVLSLVAWRHWMGLAFLGAGSAWATLQAYRHRPNLLCAALESDRRLGLEERLTSSLELAETAGPMEAALHRDARAHLGRLDVRRDFPLALPRTVRWLTIPIVAFGVAYLFLPELDLFGVKARKVAAKVEEETRRASAEQLKAAVKPLRKNENEEALKGAEDLEANLLRMADQLAAGELTEKQALAKVGALEAELEQRRNALQTPEAVPQLAANAAKLQALRDTARDVANGNFGAAAERLRGLQQQLREGSLTDEQKKKLGEELKQVSDMLEGGGDKDSALAQALAKAAAGLQMNGMPASDASQAGQGGEMSLEDAASILEQMDKLNKAMLELEQWKGQQLGPSDQCRQCGKPLKPCKGGKNCKGCGPGYSCYGMCEGCGKGWCSCNGRGPWRPGDSERFSNGMGGPGHGRGQTTGPLPNVDGQYSPAMLPGQTTQGRFLADIVQRVEPDAGAKPTAEFLSGVVTDAQQEAEQALTKEEIPAGAREFVRQYFSSFEGEAAETGEPAKSEQGDGTDAQ